MSDTKQAHWDKVYSTKQTHALGWYEETPACSLDLVAKCSLPKDARILEVGAGATTLVDHLLDLHYANVTATDISAVALETLKQRLGAERAEQVTWIVDDLSAPQHLPHIAPVDLWHDRAVLHFLVEEAQQQTYFATLKQLVKPGGHVIIAAFSLAGAKQCSGLPVKNYSREILAKALRPEFDLVEAFDYTYQMPSGDLRPFIYTLFQRT